MEAICIRIKELRNQLRMSQIEFAKNLGVTNAHISKIEKGGTVPSDALVKLISKEYQVNENWLKNGTAPVFIYEVLEKTEEQLYDSTATFNKLLSSDSYLLRELAAELKSYFSDITDVTYLDENQKIEYLSIVKNMLLLISKYNSAIKDHMHSKQFIIEDIMDSYIENYKTDIERCITELLGLMKKDISGDHD